MLFIIDANGVPSVASMVNIQGNSAPAHTLTQPTDGATFTAPATVNLTATASDADGTVTKFDFFNRAAKLGEDTTAPYSFTWSGVAAGTYTLTARATDNLGGTTTSAPSRITVSSSTNTPPTVTATASDADGNVTKVEFRDGTTVLG
jgi:Big-like domain-containing protein